MRRRRKRRRRSTTTFSCGHPRTPENTRVARGRGYAWGKCRICNNLYMRAYMRNRNRQVLLAALRKARQDAKDAREKLLS